jgi:hypothetical protein
MTSKYTFKGWTISHKGSVFTAHNGKGFFTGYHECSTTGAFLDVLESQYGGVMAATQTASGCVPA